MVIRTISLFPAARLAAAVMVAALWSGAATAHDAADHAGHGMAGAMSTGIAKGPQLAVSASFDANGTLWLARVEDGYLTISSSTDRGRSFTAPVRVNPEPERIAADGENRPKIVVDADGGLLLVSYTLSLPAPYAGHVRYARSTDGGRHFSLPMTVNDDLQITSHRFESLAADGRGRVAIAWLDKRDMLAANKKGDKYTGAALYYAISNDGGASFGPNQKLADHSCECCRVALAFAPDGTPVALWRHVFGSSTRDFALARLDGHDKPIRASQDGWQIDACPHHGGALAIDDAGGYHLAWFSGDPDRGGLFYRYSRDGGASFSTPLPVGDNNAQAGHPALLASAGKLFLAWREFDGKGYVIKLMHSDDRGERWTPARTVWRTTAAADYPLLLADGAAPYLAWNTTAEGLRLTPLAAR